MLILQYIVLILIIMALVVLSYIKSMQKGGEDLEHFLKKGSCPRCNTPIEEDNIDKRGGGCSGTQNITIQCDTCGYGNVFNVPSTSGCGITPQSSCSTHSNKNSSCSSNNGSCQKSEKKDKCTGACKNGGSCDCGIEEPRMSHSILENGIKYHKGYSGTIRNQI